MLTLQNIALKLASQKILSGIDLHIAAKQIVMLVGSNGSGKSSLLKLIDRRYPLQQGHCLIDGIALERYSAKALAHSVITLTQNPLDSLFAHLTVKENIQLAEQRAVSKQKLDWQAYLTLFNNKLLQHINTQVYLLSGGEQQALALALAIFAKPKLLLLDEHTSALDPVTAERLMALTQNIAKAQGITCLITTHHLEHAIRYGDRLIALQHGKMVQDYTEHTKAKLSINQLRQECYGVEV